MQTSLARSDEKRAEAVTVADPIDKFSVAFLLTTSELTLVRGALVGRPDQIISGIYLLDGQEAPGADPALGPARTGSRLDLFVADCQADLLVISERRDLIRREVAFAVIELALHGIPVCTVSDFLAAPQPRPQPVPDPRVVEHLLSALAAGARGQGAKRVLDVLLASLGLLVSLPLLALIAAAVRAESPGPVFFIQERLGRLRVPFRCLKFRTMQEDAEQGTGPVWASPDDPRVTRVGRFLRRSRLDELPQLINVIRGEMSIVGARPIRRHFADQLSAQVPFYDIRFVEKPGLTGWAQVTHTYSSTFTEQIEKFYHDYHYVRNCSVWLDLRIMVLTLGVMIRMKGT